MNTYEGVFILDESLKDEALEDALSGVRKDIEALGGNVESVTRLGRRPFARPQKKKKSGLFFVLTFDLDADKIAPLHGRMKLKDEIFRAQVVRAPEKREESSSGPAEPAGAESKAASAEKAKRPARAAKTGSGKEKE